MLFFSPCFSYGTGQHIQWQTKVQRSTIVDHHFHHLHHKQLHRLLLLLGDLVRRRWENLYIRGL